ncbi:MAG: transcriptional regulator NrdR [Verrucomicrobiota bacterium]
MRCTKCNSFDDKVIDSRMSKDGFSIRRRRMCIECGHRFTTYEQVERSNVLVIKHDGTRESLKRDKLLSGMIKACEKRPVSIDALEQAADEIVADIMGDGLKEVPTRVIGSKVMSHQQRIDQVAFVRYASVYRQFQDVGEFSEVIKSLEQPELGADIQPELFEALNNN